MSADGSKTLSISAPRKLAPLLDSHRYKGAYGGRGGGKSHFFAEMLLARCYSAPTRAACIREVQNSLKDSVRQLLIDKIQKVGLGWFFDVLGTETRGRNGSVIIFKGMQSYAASMRESYSCLSTQQDIGSREFERYYNGICRRLLDEHYPAITWHIPLTQNPV